MEIWEERYYDEKYGLEPPQKSWFTSKLQMKKSEH